MMETAQPWHRHNLAVCFDSGSWLTTCRRFLLQPKMRSVVVIVTDVLVHEALEMLFIQNDHMIEQISTAAANPPFCNAVLPRTSEAGPLGRTPKLFTVSITSLLNCGPRSKIR
jgi:hypothetical protein